MFFRRRFSFGFFSHKMREDGRNENLLFLRSHAAVARDPFRDGRIDPSFDVIGRVGTTRDIEVRKEVGNGVFYDGPHAPDLPVLIFA